MRKKKKIIFKNDLNEEENFELNGHNLKKKTKKNIKVLFTKNLNKEKKFLSKLKYKFKNIIYLISLIFFFSIIILFILPKIFTFNKNLKISEKELEILIKDENINPDLIKAKKEELEKVKKYMKLNMNDKLVNEIKKSTNPKISIIISVYNNGNDLIKSLLSIQKQNMKDIEIIIVDDFSTDNSVNIIKELMNKDERIVLYQNEKNKGALYTKIKGILNAKGKYLMILENKDIYVQRNAFTILYEEAEKNDLDILGFSAIINWDNFYNFFKEKYVHHFFETPIIYYNISEKMYHINDDGTINRIGDVIFNYIFKTELFIRIIKQIDDKYLNQKINYHEDFILFFLLTRNAYNLKHIKKIFYLSSRNKNKLNQNKNLTCLEHLYYADFLLNKTNNAILDKNIASYELENWYLNTQCRNNEFSRNEAYNICKLFSENKYIKDEVKKKIFLYMFENVTSIS